MAMRASALLNPNAILVSSLILVLVDSSRPLDSRWIRVLAMSWRYRAADPAGQLDERAQAAAGGPVQPRVEQLNPVRAGAGEHLP